MLVHLWVLPPDSPQRLPARVEALEVAGLQANCWAVLACFKRPKVLNSHSTSQSLPDSFLAEAIDQWFENLQNYEATLVNRIKVVLFDLFLTPYPGRNGRCLTGCKFQRRIECHRAMLVLIPIPCPLFLLKFLCRVQSSLRSRAHSRSLQSSSTLYSGANQILYHRPPANGEVGSDDCPA